MRAALIAIAMAGGGCGAPSEPNLGRDRCGAGDPPAHARIIEGRTGYARWAPPTRDLLRIDTLRGEVSGTTPAPGPTLAAWSGPTLATWRSMARGEDLRLRSPKLPPELSRAAWLELTLRPAGARALYLVAFSSSGTDVLDRVSRTTRVLLPEGLDPARPTTLKVELQELVGGNWADAWRSARLIGIELNLEGGRDATVEAVTLRDGTARYDQAAAGVDTLELAGVLRPGWFVHGGSQVGLELRVPETTPVLRWATGATTPKANSELWIVDQGRRTLLLAQDGADRWQPREASLARWAGRQVRLELANTGEGLAFFGDPSLVSGVEGATQPDVLLYLIDALRADALHAWGSPVADVSPTIDRLAAEGAQFLHAESTSNWTKPAIPTLMTGIWPTRHEVGSQRFTDRLADSVPLLQERFRDAGWRTASFSANPMGSTLSGLERGFDAASPPRRWRGQISEMGAPTADQLHRALLEWLDEEGEDRPFFAYVHTLEAHQDYRPPFTQPDPRAAYESAIRAADAELGALLGALAARPRARPLLVVLVSDHGESYGDHGLQKHGTGIYESQLHVPLVLWADHDLPTLSIDEPVSLADVAPTLLDLTGLPPLPEADGLSLRPLLEGASTLGRPWIPSMSLRFSWTPENPRQFALVDRDLQKVIQRTDGSQERYDLRADPCELRPLGDDPALSEALQRWRAAQDQESAAFEQRHGAPAPSDLDTGTLHQLRTLGYVK